MMKVLSSLKKRVFPDGDFSLKDFLVGIFVHWGFVANVLCVGVPSLLVGLIEGFKAQSFVYAGLVALMSLLITVPFYAVSILLPPGRHEGFFVWFLAVGYIVGIVASLVVIFTSWQLSPLETAAIVAGASAIVAAGIAMPVGMHFDR